MTNKIETNIRVHVKGLNVIISLNMRMKKNNFSKFTYDNFM